jgi:hypothetical protein
VARATHAPWELQRRRYGPGHPGESAERAIGAIRDTSEVGERPSGTVTFVFTDVEGPTASWEQQPDSMRSALETHDAILRSVGVPPLTGHVDYAAWSAWVGQYWFSQLMGGM